MDQEWRPAQRDGGKSYTQGRGRFVGQRNQLPPSNSTAAEDLASYVIGVLARDPDSVQITSQSVSPYRARLVISCEPAVTGRIIGKDGRTITALRQLVRAVAGRYGKRIDIDIALND